MHGKAANYWIGKSQYPIRIDLIYIYLKKWNWKQKPLKLEVNQSMQLTLV